MPVSEPLLDQFQENVRGTIHMWYTWYLSRISGIIFVEKKLSCGEISAFHVWHLWENWKYLHMWRNFRCVHMTDVEKSEIRHIWHVCDVENVAIFAKFIAIYAFLLLNLLFTLFCREISCGGKLSPKVHLWRKKWQISGLKSKYE